MKLADILRADKQQVSQSPWTDAKLRSKDFPLRGRAYPLSRSWRWSRTTFTAAQRSFALLITYHKYVPEFMAVLGERVENDSRIICRLEYHGAHPNVGWHVHAICEDFEAAVAGVVKPLRQFRVPAVSSRHRRSEFLLSGQVMNDSIAMDLALRWFRVPHQGAFALPESTG